MHRFLAVTALILAACGGSRPAPTSTLPSAVLAATPLAHGPASGEAVLTLAIFCPNQRGEPADALATRMSALVDAAFAHPPADLAHRFVRPPSLVIAAASVDADLPLNLATLVEAAGPRGEAVRTARTAVFLRYSGAPEPGDGQVWAAGLAAAVVAAELDGVVVDLGNLRAADAAEWRAALLAPGFLEGQVIPAAERAPDGTVAFRSRGLARFGLPDLEMSGVPEVGARAAFVRFQAALATLRAGKQAKAGERLGAEVLGPCAGPAERYEHECVSIKP